MLYKYKKQFIIIGTAITVVLFIIYLRALFMPGLWHGDTFLYRQNDGSYQGSDIYADYKMDIKSAHYGNDIAFSINNETNHYQLKYNSEDPNRNVEVVENGTKIFSGKAIGNENNYILFDDETGSSDMVSVQSGNTPPAKEELFPNRSRLYNWAVKSKDETRGNPYMLFLIFIFSAILFIDIKFPNFLWILEHRLDVVGGAPSEWYLFGQKIGRVVLLVGILICVVMTFTTH